MVKRIMRLTRYLKLCFDLKMLLVENTVRLKTVREHEVKGQNIPDYFQNHLS